MSNKKITDLPVLATFADDDVLPIVDVSANVTKQSYIQDLATRFSQGLQSTLISGTNIKTINSTSLLGSGDISIEANPSGSAGAIQFSDGSAFASDSNLFWDNTNKRLGVGTNTPTATIHTKGTGNTSATNALYVENSDSSQLLKLTNNGVLSLGLNFPKIAGSNVIGGFSGGFNCAYNNGAYFSVAENDPATMVMDASRNVGIGTASPTAKTHIKGSGSTSATTSLLVQNSSGTDLLKVQDDGDITNGADGNTNLKFTISPSANKFFRLTRQNTNVDFYSGNSGNAVIETGGGQPFSLKASSAWLTLSNGGVRIASTYGTPTARLEVKGSGSTSATTSLLVQNSSGADAIRVRDNGVITIGSDLKSGEQLNFYGQYGTRLRILTTATLDSITGSIVNAGQDYSGSNNLILASKGINSTTNVYIIPSTFTSLSGSVLVNTTTDVASSVLTVESTTKGFLPPRMTTTERDAIATPATGLQVYDTDTATQQIYDGTSWRNTIQGDNTNLFWDNTNKRLGVGTSSPTAKVQISQSFGASSLAQLDRMGVFVGYSASTFGIAIGGASTSGSAAIQGTNQNGNFPSRLTLNPFGGNVAIGQVASGTGLATLEIKGSGSTSATTSLLVQNSSGTELLKVDDSGNVLLKLGAVIGASNYSRNIFFESQMTIRSFDGVTLQNYNGSSYSAGLTLYGYAQNVGIGTSTPTAKLQVDSTVSGFLPPRMTTTQKNAISSPAAGLVVYDSTTNKLCCYNGTSWNDLF